MGDYVKYKGRYYFGSGGRRKVRVLMFIDRIRSFRIRVNVYCTFNQEA